MALVGDSIGGGYVYWVDPMNPNHYKLVKRSSYGTGSTGAGTGAVYYQQDHAHNFNDNGIYIPYLQDSTLPNCPTAPWPDIPHNGNCATQITTWGCNLDATGGPGSYSHTNGLQNTIDAINHFTNTVPLGNTWGTGNVFCNNGGLANNAILNSQSNMWAQLIIDNPTTINQWHVPAIDELVEVLEVLGAIAANGWQTTGSAGVEAYVSSTQVSPNEMTNGA